jgi:hypothetical protein
MKVPEIPAWPGSRYISKGKFRLRMKFSTEDLELVYLPILTFQNTVKNTTFKVMSVGRRRMKSATMLAPRLSSKVVASVDDPINHLLFYHSSTFFSLSPIDCSRAL